MPRIAHLLAATLIATLISPIAPAFSASVTVSNPAAVPTIGPARTVLGANPMPFTPFGKPGPIPGTGSGTNAVAWPHPGSQPLELVQDRTATSQTFLNPNGTFTTVVSPQPRFYQSPNTHVWHALNTTLTADAAGTGFHTASTPFGLHIAKTPGSGATVTLTQGPDQVGFRLQGAAAVAGTVSGGHAQFANILPHVSATYTATPTGVREDLILNRAAAPNQYPFPLTLAGLTPTLDASGAVQLANARGQVVATIQAPTVTDAAGATTPATVTLPVVNGQPVYTLTVPAAWLTASHRMFPVDVDPTITLQPTAATGRDTFVSATYPTSNYATNPNLLVGTDPTYGTTRSLIQFQNLPTLVAGATSASILSANLSVYQTNSNEGGQAIDLYRAASPWTSGTVTWNTQPSTGTVVLDSESVASSPASPSNAYVGTWTFPITNLVKWWYDQSYANDGLELQAANESSATTEAIFNASDASQNQPELSITYAVEPVGTAPFWTQDANGVNVADSNLTLSAQDVAIPGRGTGLSVVRTFNSLNNGRYQPNHPDYFGTGWNSNLDLSLSDAGQGPIVFIDAQGREHIFVPTANYTGPYMTDPQDPGLTLDKNPANPNPYVVTTESGTQYTFNPSGQLVSIAVPSAGGSPNTTTLTYNSSGILTTITDPAGRTLTVTVDAAGQITQITDPAGRVLTYTYNANGDLTQATLAASAGSSDTTTTSYTYNSSNQLTGVTDPNGNTTTIAYNGTSNTSAVTSISQPTVVNGTATTATTTYAWVSTANGGEQTTVTDPAGRVTQYNTDGDGLLSAVIQDPGASPHLNLTTSYTWDQWWRPTGVTDPNGHTTTLGYDPNAVADGPTQLTSPLATQTFSYTAHGHASGGLDPTGSSGQTYQNGSPIDGINSLSQDTATVYGSAANGQPTAVSTPLAMGDNVIPNSSFETIDPNTSWPVEWEDGSANMATQIQVSSTADYGSHSIAIAADGSAYPYLSNNVLFQVIPGANYNLSAALKAVGVGGTTLSNSNGRVIGATINVHWYQTPTTASAINPETYYNDNTIGTTGWQRHTSPVTAPADAHYAFIDLVLYGATGTAYFDGVQMEPLNPNVLLNAGFDQNALGSTAPANWTATNWSASDGIQSGALNGLNAVQIAGSAGSTSLVQTLPAPTYPWTGIQLFGWSNQSGATADGSAGNGGTAADNLDLVVHYTDGTSAAMPDIPFSATTSGWQLVNNVFAASTLANGKTIQDIQVVINYGNETGTTQFADVQARMLAAYPAPAPYNAIQNPSFVYDYQNQSTISWPDGWTQGSGTGSAIWQGANGIGFGYDDTHSLELTAPPSGASGPESVASQTQMAYTGTPVTATAWVQTQNLSGPNAYLAIQAWDNGTLLGTIPSQAVGTTGAWTRLLAVADPSQIPSGTTRVTVGLYLAPDANGANAAAYFDDVALYAQRMAVFRQEGFRKNGVKFPEHGREFSVRAMF